MTETLNFSDSVFGLVVALQIAFILLPSLIALVVILWEDRFPPTREMGAPKVVPIRRIGRRERPSGSKAA